MNGQVFGNYKIEQKLGEGGMGAVFRGVDMMLEREVAIKFLRPELSSQPQVVERFRSEAVTLAKLNHPNIATLYNFMRQGDSFFMVLEFVRGATLDNVIQQRGAMPSEHAIPLFCQVLDGIQHAHDFGIIHRDIKPANMMFTEKGTLKVLDFGIARILGTARMTRQGNIIGTIEYMSPEQVRGFETDARSDIYSLGMLLYEMLTGKCPFQIENEFELMKAQIEQYPVPPRQLNPAIPESVEQAIWKSIQKDPAQRFQSASEFRTFLLNAGFAATGRIEPLAVGDPSAFGTRPITQTPGSSPSSPYATVPMQPGYTAPSQPGVSTPSQPGAQTSQPGVSTPSQPGLPPTPASNPGVSGAGIDMNATIIDPSPPNTSAAKETRVGAPGSFAPAQRDSMKETRIGVGPSGGAAATPPQGYAQPKPFAPQPAQQSFMSKLTWVHFAGAGVAVVVVVGVVITVAAFALYGSKKANQPAKPASLTEQPSKPAQPQPTQQAAPPAADQTTVGTQTGDTNVIPIEKPVATAPAVATEGPSRATPKPPSQPKKADSSAAERERRRKAALDALNQ
jgi:serine/threonine protein kinase